MEVQIWEAKLQRELEGKAAAEGFSSPADLAKFLITKALELNVKRSFDSKPYVKRPPLAVGDKVRLTKRARNSRYGVPRNATMVVLSVDTTVLCSYSRSLRNRGLPQERRVDPSNGHCEVTVAFKHKGVWKKYAIYRKDLYKIQQ